MASNDGAAPLARLREAVERQVSERSLRHAARQVGMSPTGLQKFLAGSAPSDATCRKLERWAFEKAAAGEPPTAETALAVLRLLAGALPPRRHPEAVVRLLAVLESAFDDGARPAWLLEARRALDAPPDDSIP
ncbi:MAG TPA: hypothetical protein VK420_14200 [Longimicrobium sp.]|nr:hypothetical protein [Longimicrobium sp.]